MNDIVNILYYALEEKNIASNPFETNEVRKAFDSAYSKWNDMAKIADNDVKNNFIIYGALDELVSEERKQAFKVGLRTAFQLMMNLN